LAVATALASDTKASLHIVTVGIPFFSSSVESWILHDVHDPQSQIPLNTTWHSVASFSISSRFKAAPVSFSPFLMHIIPANLNLLRNNSSNLDKKISKFGLPLSTSNSCYCPLFHFTGWIKHFYIIYRHIPTLVLNVSLLFH